MTDELLEQLLHEDEGAYLDFKRDQYPFSGATDEQKSELLKDILAFANSWRRTDAYILIGVDEVVGGRSTTVGVACHLDDADLQQFVNSKTNRPVRFRYLAYPYEGVQLGILWIELQDRPLYLSKRFGKCNAGEVYIRHGSATRLALPDEVASIGNSSLTNVVRTPSLDLQFSNPRTNTRLGTDIPLKCSIVSLSPELRKRSDPPSGPYGVELPDMHRNLYYYRDWGKWWSALKFHQWIGFSVENRGTFTARDVRLQLVVPKNAGVKILDEETFPSAPSEYFYENIVRPDERIALAQRDVKADEYAEAWSVSAKFGDLHPRSVASTKAPLWVGAEQNGVVQIEAEVSAEDLASPLKVPLRLRFEVESLDVSFRDFLAWKQERGRRYREEHGDD